MKDVLGDGFSLRKKKLGLGWAMNNHSPCSVPGSQCTTLSSGADPKTPGWLLFGWSCLWRRIPQPCWGWGWI